jgi:hypothetical protein
VAAGEAFGTPCSDAWIREIVCCSRGLSQLGVNQNVAARRKIELFCITARPEVRSVLAEYRIKSIALQLFHEDFVCA